MPSQRRKTSSKKGLKHLLLGHLPLEEETVMFVVVNFIDYVMTYLLISSGMFRESNPVAGYFLNHWGPIKGMLYFKTALIVFVCVITQLIALKSVTKARWVLNFGTVAVSVVVIYSLAMYLRQSGF